ncbi:MAG: hypothetical protein QY326_08930 [Bdellovibrionota bacterium]|nr:MAG: hypothetical protein QY326_08930 [Bdellovibrionota bacterium]
MVQKGDLPRFDGSVMFITVMMPSKAREGLLPRIAECYPKSEFVEAGSLLDALEQSRENDYVVCMIPDAVTLDDFEAFKRDLCHVRRAGSFQIVQVCQNDIGVKELPSAFDAGITYAWTVDDRHRLERILATFSILKDSAERIEALSKALELMLRHIDKTAAARKQGRKKRLASPMSGYIDHQVAHHQDLRNDYLETLEQGVAKAKPAKAVRVAVPAKLLKRALPELEPDGYKGVSDRVSESVSDRFGNDDDREE